AVRELRRMVIGQEEAAGAETDVFGLQERLRQQQIRRRGRLPTRGAMLADPGFLIAEFIQPPQHLKVPVVAFFQPALRRMRGHRKISEFHGHSSRRYPCFDHASAARKEEHSTPGVWPRYDKTGGLRSHGIR